ncbi:chromosome segregation ATPase [Desmospora activa DSM 45169]|uniref:Sporulation initiation inhibitor protein Soj n=1 Tax=Desmospora activa DSM 45169 TaxID=1121389 RepID=A0A2T4Z4W7_9BACL|nr:chromosome segregation ATPase [Desmospora activa DSM 45169]
MIKGIGPSLLIVYNCSGTAGEPNTLKGVRSVRRGVPQKPAIAVWQGAWFLPYKTTTSINLGASLAHQGKKTLIVDIDPQGNTTSGLGINKADVNQCIYDVLINETPVSQVIHSTSVEGLSLIPATIELAGAEIELVQTLSREHRLKRALHGIQNDYDFILIDCPPSLSVLTINSLTAANSVLIPIQCEFYALEGLGQLLNTIRIVQKHLNKRLEIEGVLLTMFDGRTNLSTQVMDEVKKYFQQKVYNTVIPRNVRLSEAPSHGTPILHYDARSKGSECYVELAKEVIQNGR